MSMKSLAILAYGYQINKEEKHAICETLRRADLPCEDGDCINDLLYDFTSDDEPFWNSCSYFISQWDDSLEFFYVEESHSSIIPDKALLLNINTLEIKEEWNQSMVGFLKRLGVSVDESRLSWIAAADFV